MNIEINKTTYSIEGKWEVDFLYYTFIGEVINKDTCEKRPVNFYVPRSLFEKTGKNIMNN